VIETGSPRCIAWVAGKGWSMPASKLERACLWE
jgi:hypothetical protein